MEEPLAILDNLIGVTSTPIGEQKVVEAPASCLLDRLLYVHDVLIQDALEFLCLQFKYCIDASAG
jgi:hypothetical protein